MDEGVGCSSPSAPFPAPSLEGRKRKGRASKHTEKQALAAERANIRELAPFFPSQMSACFCLERVVCALALEAAQQRASQFPCVVLCAFAASDNENLYILSAARDQSVEM